MNRQSLSEATELSTEIPLATRASQYIDSQLLRTVRCHMTDKIPPYEAQSE